MSDIAHLDFETYSAIDIRKVGAHRYARHPSTEVLIACFYLPEIDDIVTWLPRTEKMPVKLRRYIERGGAVSYTHLRAHETG
jgi:hypothetical protein